MTMILFSYISMIKELKEKCERLNLMSCALFLVFPLRSKTQLSAQTETRRALCLASTEINRLDMMR